MRSDAESIARLAKKTLPLTSAVLPEDYYYQSFTLCVINAVFSINTRYQAARNVVDRYCDHYGLQRLRNNRDQLPDTESQEPTSSLCRKYEEIGAESFAEEIFQNKQRTSTRSGITKSEAVFRTAGVFRHHGVEFLQDIPEAMDRPEISRAIRAIPGQASGISLGYLWMLAGSDDHIKPDRMIVRFLERALGYPPSPAEARDLLSTTVNLLKPLRPDLTPRLLDFMVWKHQSAQRRNRKSPPTHATDVTKDIDDR